MTVKRRVDHRRGCWRLFENWSFKVPFMSKGREWLIVSTGRTNAHFDLNSPQNQLSIYHNRLYHHLNFPQELLFEKSKSSSTSRSSYSLCIDYHHWLQYHIIMWCTLIVKGNQMLFKSAQTKGRERPTPWERGVELIGGGAVEPVTMSRVDRGWEVFFFFFFILK